LRVPLGRWIGEEFTLPAQRTDRFFVDLNAHSRLHRHIDVTVLRQLSAAAIACTPAMYPIGVDAQCTIIPIECLCARSPGGISRAEALARIENI
jgi:hypothetical protein